MYNHFLHLDCDLDSSMTTLYSPSHHQRLPSGTPPDQQAFTGDPGLRPLHRTPSDQMTSQQRPPNRLSGDYSNRRSFSGSGNSPMAVPGSSAPYQNGHSRNVPAVPAVPSFDMARSPPNPATKSEPVLSRFKACTDSLRYKTCSLQIFQARRMSSRSSMPLPSFDRWHS